MEKKTVALTKVINFLKTKESDLPYDVLPGINLRCLPSVTDCSDALTDLKIVSKMLTMPIVQPIKAVVDRLIEEKSKFKGKPSKEYNKVLELLKSEVSPTTSAPLPPKKVAKNVNKKKVNFAKKEKKAKNAKVVLADPSSMIKAEEFKLVFNNNVKWWRPFETASNGMYEPKCFCGKECKKETNQWNLQKEIVCKAPQKSRCGFRMSCYAFVKFMEYLKNVNANYFPIPKCSCQKLGMNHGRLVLRGSAPQTENFKLWYYCEDCRTTFFIKDYESKIRKTLQAQPNIVNAESDGDDSGTEEEEIDADDDDEDVEDDESSMEEDEAENGN